MLDHAEETLPDGTSATATATRPAPPSEAAKLPPLPKNIIARISEPDIYQKLTESLLAHLCAFRRYEASRQVDTVGGAQRRIRQIELEMSSHEYGLPQEQVHALQAEMARLGAVSHASEVEAKRAIRGRAVVCHNAFKAWGGFVLEFAERIRAERVARVTAFARDFGMAYFETPVVAEVDALIAVIRQNLDAAEDEVVGRGRVLNQAEVDRIGCAPTYYIPHEHSAPSVRNALALLRVFGVDVTPVYAAAGRLTTN